jgi:hypothetical protein
MSRFEQFIQQHAEQPSIGLKMINWAAAALGVGTFLQLVNMTVGVLSAVWLTAQLYGYIRRTAGGFAPRWINFSAEIGTWS